MKSSSWLALRKADHLTSKGAFHKENKSWTQMWNLIAVPPVIGILYNVTKKILERVYTPGLISSIW